MNTVAVLQMMNLSLRKYNESVRKILTDNKIPYTLISKKYTKLVKVSDEHFEQANLLILSIPLK